MSADRVTESAFAHPWSADRLRQHARWAGVLLVATLLVPYQTIDQRTMLLWQLLPEMTTGQRLASLAPAVAGGAVLVASFASRASSSLATISAAACAAGVMIPWTTSLGAGQRWDGLRGAAPAAVVVALVAAAEHLRHAPTGDDAWAKRRAQLLLGAAAVVAAAYEWASPWLDETAVDMFARAVGRVASRPTPGQLFVCLSIAPVALWSWVALALGCIDTLVPGARRRPLPWVIAFYTGPALLLPVAMQTLSGRSGSGVIAAVIGEMMVVAATATLLAHAAATWRRASGSAQPSLRWRRVVAGVTWLAVGGALALSCALATERRNALAWHPTAADADADRLYDALIPAWNDGRGSAAEMIPIARAVDGRLAQALERMTRAADRDQATPARWQQLVGQVNRAAARADLPYHLEAGDIVVHGGGDARRSFRLDAHRIVRARRFRWNDESLTTLHVRSTVPGRARLHTLGSSRDADAWVTVALDAIEAYADELAALAAGDPAGCFERPWQLAIEPEALRGCAELLATIDPRTLVRELTATVERHELQHRLDGAALSRAVVVERRLRLHDIDLQRRVNRELSAYLAQMTVAGQAPTLTLVRLFRFAALDRAGPEKMVALLAFEALLGGEVADSAQAFGQAFSALAALGTEALRSRAASAWRAQFGETLPTPETIE